MSSAARHPYRQIPPGRIHAFDQRNLLPSTPLLNLSFASDRVQDVLVFFKIDEPIDFVFTREVRANREFVLLRTPGNVVCHSNVEGSTRTRHDVNEEEVGTAHPSKLAAGAGSRCDEAHVEQVGMSRFARHDKETQNPLRSSGTSFFLISSEARNPYPSVSRR